MQAPHKNFRAWVDIASVIDEWVKLTWFDGFSVHHEAGRSATKLYVVGAGPVGLPLIGVRLGAP